MLISTLLCVVGTRRSVRHSGVSGLTSGAAEAFPLLPPLGIAQDVDDQRGKLAGVEPGQLLAPLQREEPGTEESENCAVLPPPGGCVCNSRGGFQPIRKQEANMTSGRTMRDWFCKIQQLEN